MNFKCRGSIVTVVITLLLFLPKLVVAQTPPESDPYGRFVNGVSEPWWFPESISKEKAEVVQKRWSAFKIEKATEHERVWAGDYFIGGDTHGSYLRWSEEGGFVRFDVDKCAAQVMGFSYGKAIVSPGFLLLVPEQKITSSSRHNHSTAATKFLLVKWRADQLLVPESEIEDFGDYVAGLGRYNEWPDNYIEGAVFFYKFNLKVEANETSSDQVSNLEKGYVTPVVPVGYDRFIKRPITAEITAVGKGYRRHDRENEWWDDLIVPVTLNAGKAHGVKLKMKFRMVGTNEIVQVTKLGSRTSQGMVVRTIRKRPCVKFSDDDDCSEPEYDDVKIGHHLITPVPGD